MKSPDWDWCQHCRAFESGWPVCLKCGASTRVASASVSTQEHVATMGKSEAQSNTPKSASATLRARILQAGANAWPDTYIGWHSAMGASALAAAREALRYVLELDEDDTKDRPPTNVIIAQALADLGGS